MNFIKSFFTQTVKYQNWGWNTITLTLFFVIILTIIQGWGIWRQNKKIWQNKSGKSLSLTFFIFQFSYFTAYLIYGIDRGSLAITINNLLGALFVPIIIGLIKYKDREKDLSIKELILSSLFILIIPIILLVDNKDLILIIVFVIAGISVIPQILEIIRSKETTNIELKFIIVFLISGTLWLLYGLAIHSLALITSSAPTILLSLIFLIMYVRYSTKKVR